MTNATLSPVGAMASAPSRPLEQAPRSATEPKAFVQMLSSGLDQVNQKIATADRLASAFAANDSVPLHEVTYALQEARLSLQFMLQARTRLVDAYQQLTNLQL
jgi:flagellar hook-basal body complex protein FliE